MSETRKLIGKSASVTARTQLYQTAEGFEVDTSEAYEIVQRRVLFGDVQLVTIHREYGPTYLIVTGMIALFFLTVAGFVFALGSQTVPAALIVLAIGSPAFVAFVLRAAFGVEVVTIFGRRSKASLRFRLRKQRAREVYGEICAAVRTAQRMPAPEVPAEREESGAAGLSPPAV